MTKALSVFVTVGTTRFDMLIQAISDPAFHISLIDLGVQALCVQAGVSPWPGDPVLPLSTTVVHNGRALAIQVVDYLPSLTESYDSADLVICHAGAGTIFEVLRHPRRPRVITVPNPTLMHGHQSELAGAMEAEGYLFSATTSTVCQTALRVLGDIVTLQHSPGREAVSAPKELPPPPRGVLAQIFFEELAHIPQ
ncbi:hypothetical protein H696_01137 [Fonticula alba]|uniref:UDP-N-acetylglucosamine transferase subunit ALG13 n=1 Tax=Fonticula alba TaxID=691883 RepID=A0A058ZBB5_FONAL|nr:hypothetical protein H696_01137 [Fonticula alba]KCV71715.1 hypothetical protein H696_01137 [Fonticula alba]|eukprot:XP_009493293.1 hypothetical protein H696_01137 [Fonticula alba]